MITTLNIIVIILIKFSKFIMIFGKNNFYHLKFYAHLRYSLEDDRPSQTTNLKTKNNILFCFNKKLK